MLGLTVLGLYMSLPPMLSDYLIFAGRFLM